jgi:hypothetical protein
MRRGGGGGRDWREECYDKSGGENEGAIFDDEILENS